MKTLLVWVTWLNYFFSTLKNEKRKHLNIAVSKITELILRMWFFRVQYFANFKNLSKKRKILYPQHKVGLADRETYLH